VNISPTADIIDDIRLGRMVVLVDAEDRENEGDLVLAADFVTPEAINFMATHARGLICLTLTEERCRQLALPLMVSDNRSPHGTAFTVSIEAATGVSTGISAADRARTVRTAVAKHAKPGDIVQPGHIFPVMAQNGGVLVRAGHTEAGCDLAEAAGLTPAAVICEVMKPDGEMARLPDLVEFAARHELKLGTIADLIRHRSVNEKLIERVADRPIATPYGPFRLCVYHDIAANELHYALVRGEPSPDRPVLVRVHEPFHSIDMFDFDASRHAYSVQDSMRIIAHHKEGVIVLLRRHEPADEVLARFSPAPPQSRGARKWDPKLHGIGAQILRDLGVGRMRVLARPKRIPSMAGFGLEVVEYVSPDDAPQVKAL
jgi:3,4-dihydroxy 2-butanone 4-phosphate synthase/GTP cyclohydrolase II